MMTQHHNPPALLRYDEPLARHTSWRIGGPARFYAEAKTVAELQTLLRWAHAAEVPLLYLGGGTNMLVRDSGFDGLVVRYRAQEWQLKHHDDGQASLHVAGGATLAGTARRVAAQGWQGLEWAEGVPGTVGGAVVGNSGCYGGDVAGLLDQATLLVNNEIVTWPSTTFAYRYRSSAVKALHRAGADSVPFVLGAVLRLQRGDAAELTAKIARIASERKSKTPWGRSCGSVFKNPPGSSAGRLIDEAGLKGRQVGAAAISERHGNYIVNLGGASSDDVLGLVELARDTVVRQCGIELELEVSVIG